MNLILLLFITCAFSKCLVWKQYRHTSSSRKDVGGSRVGYGFGYGYGYESLSSLYSCTDHESYHQCNWVQKLLDTYKIGTNLQCFDHMECMPTLPSGNGKWWCVNQNSQDLCKLGQDLLSNYTIINCNDLMVRQDNIPILFYIQPQTKTTTIILNTNITNATISSTDPPSSAIYIKPMFILIATLLIFLS